MKIFIDSASIKDIEEANSFGILDGVTTNPSLIAKNGGNIREIIKNICFLVKGRDVSAEVFAEDYISILKEAEILYSISENIVLKLPLTIDGIRACKYFSAQGRKTNVTLCFSANQALLAAKAGATYISPFIGRLDDVGENGVELIYDIKKVFSNYPSLKTQILAASIRSGQHVEQSAKAGADAATISLKIIKELYEHKLTDKGLEIFRKDASACVPIN
jgi:transaldolase